MTNTEYIRKELLNSYLVTDMQVDQLENLVQFVQDSVDGPILGLRLPDVLRLVRMLIDPLNDRIKQLEDTLGRP